MSTLLTGIFVQVLKAKNKTKRSRASPKYNKRRGKRGGGAEDLKNGEHARDRVTSRKGGANAGGRGHREREREKVPQASSPGRKLATENVPLTSFIPVSLLPPSQQFGGFGEAVFTS